MVAPPSGLNSLHRPSFYVREIPVYGDVVLSPMAGFSDLPYRSLCREYGSAMSYTEFISVVAFLAGPNQKTLDMLAYLPQERPVVFQIFDNDESRIVECAKRLEEFGPDIIDLNMGCSVRKVSGRGAGAALLRDPSKIGRIFSRLSGALKVPVTGKIRLGWDSESRNYRDVVRAIQENGGSLVAVHARTKEMAYSGQADWEAIARIVEIAQVPVIGNGDVRCVRDVAAMKRLSGCQAVMVGRGAIGHPWIFRRRDREDVPFRDKALFIRQHFQRMSEFYGERRALVLIRKHIVRYLKGYAGIRDLHLQLVQVSSRQQLMDLLEETTARLEVRGNRGSSIIPRRAASPGIG